MKRRLERDIRAGIQAEGTRLYESDYLLGVHHLYRVGALRYKLEDEGEFLDSIPYWLIFVARPTDERFPIIQLCLLLHCRLHT
ncbi:hypothetical protein [Brenneria goodwinii]|uniref:hypothetical protein n=1 Tax=Brenneria goodwinii TaxID=1109412 RepID=UPI0036E6CDF7